MKVQMLPVYSRLAEEADVPEVTAQLPAGWRLSRHQIRIL